MAASCAVSDTAGCEAAGGARRPRPAAIGPAGARRRPRGGMIRQLLIDAVVVVVVCAPRSFYATPPANHSIVAHRVLLLEAAARDGAVAIDGSPASYHIAQAPPSSPNMSKWHVHLQGGGWCWTVADCAGRALGSKGSSNLPPNNHSVKLLPDECACAQSGYFSADPVRNPTMHDWNHVHINYVDGGSFSGNRSAPVFDPATNRTLYFRGKRILRAVLLDLLGSRGMRSATQMVLSGCSAGGLAVYLQADYVASLLPSATRLVAVPDSGYFLGVTGTSFDADMRNAATRFFNMETNAACQSAVRKPGDCAFAQYVAPFVQTPIFAVQSIFDGWQMDEIARPRDWGRVVNSSFGQHCCRGESKDCLATVNRFGSTLNASVSSVLLQNPKNGAFVDSCNHHCGSWSSDLTAPFMDPRVGGTAVAYAFDQWYGGGSTRVWRQGQQFPCRGCCHSAPVLPVGQCKTDDEGLISQAAAGCALPAGVMDVVLALDPNPAITRASNLTASDLVRCHAEPAAAALVAHGWACGSFRRHPVFWHKHVLSWRVLNEPLQLLRRSRLTTLVEDIGPLFAQLAQPLVQHAATTDAAVQALVASETGVFSPVFVDLICSAVVGDPSLSACRALKGRALGANASVAISEDTTLAPLDLLSDRGARAAPHGTSLAVYLCAMLRAVGIPARTAAYPQRGTAKDLWRASNRGFDGKVPQRRRPSIVLDVIRAIGWLISVRCGCTGVGRVLRAGA
eukprot:COSAG01_NODE_2954_length_6801_cov_3.612951_1_plen_737_part_00